MADQQSRDGKKQGANNPNPSEQQHTPHASQSRPESSKPTDQERKPMGRTQDDPSEAPESGDKKVTGTV